MNANENQMLIEVFQYENNGQIQQVTLGELKNWIRDGKLQPVHRVRIKNLPWMEAQKIPAFTPLFEAKKNSPEAQSNNSHSQSLPGISTIAQIKQEIAATAVVTKKPSLAITGTLVKPDTEAAVPSVPFKLFEKKMSAKSENDEAVHDSKNPPLSIVNATVSAKTEIAEPTITPRNDEKSAPVENEKEESKNVSASEKKEPREIAKAEKKESKTAPKANPSQPVTKPQKKSSLVKKTASFLFGCILVALISFGGSYLWVYYLKGPVEVDEKNLTELLSLEDKLTSDKVELRLKAAAKEKELKTAGNQEQSAQQTDISQEIAKLDQQYSIQRKSVIDNYRENSKTREFNVTFPFSGAVLLFLFVLMKIFYGKNSQPAEAQPSSKSLSTQTANSLNNSAATRNVGDENSQNIHTTKTVNVHITKSADVDTTNSPESSNDSEAININLHVTETEGAAESQASNNCLLHRDALAKFVCGDCKNYFCEECPKTFEEKENCCPFCQVVCKPADTQISEAATPKPSAEVKKKNLLELGQHKDFVIYDYPDERTRRLGIIPAFIISLLFSASISIFWVYKIAPYLENRGKEVAQNVSPNDVQKTEKGNAAKAIEQGSNTANTNANTTAPTLNSKGTDNSTNEPCIDPETKQAFECDEQMRRALSDHTKKVQSVEKAQKEVKEKTTLILSLVSPEAREEVARKNQQNTPPNPEEELRKGNDKRLLVKVFAGSFLIIFGLLLSPRLFSKD